MLLEIEPYSIQANMQRAGRRAKKDNTNKAKSSRGSASANQNVININLGHLTERTVTERKKKKIETKKKRPVKKEAEEKPVVKKPKTEPKPEVERLMDLKKQYTELTRSVDMRMIPEGCRDVPDRLLTPTTPEQVRELIRYLEDCIRKILSSYGTLRTVSARSGSHRPVGWCLRPESRSAPLRGCPQRHREREGCVYRVRQAHWDSMEDPLIRNKWPNSRGEKGKRKKGRRRKRKKGRRRSRRKTKNQQDRDESQPRRVIIFLRIWTNKRSKTMSGKWYKSSRRVDGACCSS
jgi:hypothetical protein